MDYLKNKQTYVDRYDLHTIEECLDYYSSVKDRFLKQKDTQFAKYTQKRFEQEVKKCLKVMLFSLKGENYCRKKETIQKWMNRDQAMQELYDNTPSLLHVRCNVCGSPARLKHKTLHDSYEPTAYMLFMFGCTKCNKRQALLKDGSEWKYEPPICPKCNHPLESDIKVKGDISTYVSKCKNCGYKTKDVSDHKKFRLEQEAKEKRNKDLLEKYRGEFCLSDKEGQEYLEHVQTMEYATKIKDEEIKKYDNVQYSRSLKIKKLSFIALEKLLSEKLEKEGYIKLSLEKPDLGQFVVVPFSTQDSNSSRKSSESIRELQKLIKTVLEETNWRLMSDGVTNRLGYITGRLKGVENEEDLYELGGKKKERKTSTEDEEKRMKYAGNNVIELMRLMGEMEGIKRIRTRRLEKEPEGFLLEPNEGPYQCCVCRASINGNEAWWDLKGIKCLDCQRNLKEGIIPPEFFDEDYGYDVIVKDWELKSYYGIHPSTIQKLCRQGALKSRDLKRKDGSVYEQLFLVSENKEFFEAHPKKKPSIKIYMKDNEDKETEVK